MMQAEHQEFCEKVSKLPLKELVIDQNSSYIQYQQ